MLARRFHPMGALVIGSPIWYGHVDTRTFNFINRTYVYNKHYSEENAKKWPKAKAVNVLTYAKKMRTPTTTSLTGTK